MVILATCQTRGKFICHVMFIKYMVNSINSFFFVHLVLPLLLLNAKLNVKLSLMQFQNFGN